MFTYDINVRYRDVDPLRHVSHVEFVTYMQQARLSYLETKFDMSERGIDPVVVHIEVDYLDSIELGETVTVKVTCGDPGNTSFRTDYEILANGNTVATGHSIQVVADKETGETLPLPDDWRAKMG